MYSKVKIAGRPVHPMLIVYPVAFYTTTLILYIVYNSNADPFYFKVAVLANVAGVIMAAVAAIPGFIDWLNIPSGTKPKITGASHSISNVLALALFGLNLWIQCPKYNDPKPSIDSAIVLSAYGFILTIAGGFLGWALVQKHHVGVEPLKEELPDR